MNIFLSWSGSTSKKIAEVLKVWLPSVIQSVKPFYSPDDISKGKLWSGEISKHLSETNFGILIMTSQNVNAPWIMFEAGALSKNIEVGRGCTFLFNIKDTDVKGPLALFQNTKFTKSDVQKLLVDINNYLGERAVENNVLSKVFEKMWPDLESDIERILSEENNSAQEVEVRPERELIEESLRLLRKMNYNHIVFDNNDFDFDGDVKVVFNKKDGNITFYNRKKEEVYWINIQQLTSTGEVLDFIFQIARKGWCKAKHIADFVNCIEEISEEFFKTNAQGIFSPFGAAMKVDWVKKVSARLQSVKSED